MSLETVREAYESAQGAWTGINWTCPHGYYEIDIDGMDPVELRIAARAALQSETYECEYTSKFWREHFRQAEESTVSWATWAMLADELRSAARYLDRVAKSAAEAEECAAAAMAAAEGGEWDDALDLASQAAGIESEYGDSPTWGGFVGTIRDTMIEESLVVEAEQEAKEDELTKK